MTIYLLAVVIAAYLQELQSMQIEHRCTRFHYKSYALGLHSHQRIQFCLVVLSFGVSIIHQFAILAMYADYTQIVSKLESADIFGILVVIAFKDIFGIPQFGYGKQRSRRAVYLRREFVYVAVFVGDGSAAHIAAFAHVSHGDGGLVIASVFCRSTEGIAAHLHVRDVSVWCHSHGSGGHNVVTFQIPCA